MGKGTGQHCYPLNQEARRAHLAARPPVIHHPAPEVPARPATEDEIPTGAKRLIKAARAADWDTRVTYARGTALPSAATRSVARPAKVVACVMVTFRRVPPYTVAVGDAAVPAVERAVATWIDGAFDTAYTIPIRRVGARELRAIIDAPAGEVAP